MKLNDVLKGESRLTAMATIGVVALFVATLGAGSASALAAGGPPNGTPGAPGGGPPNGTPGAPGGSGQGADQALANYNQRLQKTSDEMNHRLEVAQLISTKLQALIADHQGKGCSTAALETALAVFNQHITVAQGAHTQGMGLLLVHPGADNHGNVVDHQQMLAGIKAMRDQFLTAHKAFVDAVKDLRSAFTNEARQCGQSHAQGTESAGQGGQGQGTETPEPTEQPGG